MATTLRTWGLSALVLLCIGVVGWAAAPVPLPAPEGLPKWEYCEVQQHSNGRQIVIRWVVGEEETEGANWQELAEKLKVPAAKKDATEATQRVRVLNRLGGDGWELVGMHKENPATFAFRDKGLPSTMDVWSFKRKVAK
jgi:hypothetical protein